MGSSESTLSSSSSSLASSSAPPTQHTIDEITTVTERKKGIDPLLQRFNSLQITPPILTTCSPSPTEESFTDILIKKSVSSSSISPAYWLNPAIQYGPEAGPFGIPFDPDLNRAVQDIIERLVPTGDKQTACMNQEEIENKIEVVDALAVKLLQRFNYSVSAMRTTAHHLAEVQPLQVEVGELKGRLTEVISNCDALCKRIATEGPESLRSSVKPFSESISGIESEHNSSSLTTNLIRNSSATNPS